MVHPAARDLHLTRVAIRALLVLLTTAAILAACLVLALSLGGATWAANRLLGGLQVYPGATLRCAEATGNLFTGLELHDVRLTRANGEITLRLDTLRLRYELPSLLGHEVVVRELQLAGPKVVLRRLPDSSWDLPRLPRRTAGAPTSAGRVIHIQRVSLTRGGGLLDLGGPRGSSDLRVEGVEVQARQVVVTRGVRVGAAALRLRLLPPGEPRNWAVIETRGSLDSTRLTLARLTWRSPHSAISARATIPVPRGRGNPVDLGGLEVSLLANPVAYRDLHPLHPALDRRGSFALRLEVRGKGQRATVRADARFSDGGSALVRGLVTPPTSSSLDYRLHGTFRSVDPSLFTLDPSGSDRVSGDITAVLSGPRMDRLDGRIGLRIIDSRYASFHTPLTVAGARLVGGRALVTVAGQVGSLGLRLGGWMRPLDSIPSYDLTARVRRLPGRTAAAWLERLAGGNGARLSIRLRGRGVGRTRSDLRARATLTPGDHPRGVLDSGAVQATVAGGSAEVQARFGVGGGVVAFPATLTLDRVLGYSVRRGTIHGVDLAAMLGDSTASAIHATFSVHGEGVSRGSARLRAAIALPRARYGAHTLSGGRMSLQLAREHAHLSARATLDGAALDLEARAHPFAAQPTLTVERMRFRHLDLARLVPRAGIASDISGTGSLEARGGREQDRRTKARLSLEGSRVGGEPVERGSIEASLARGDLELRVELEAPAGKLALAGAARPFDSVPSWTVREGSFRELELGRLFGVGGLRTRLTGSLRGEGSGRKPAGARLAASLLLGPSLVNRAAIRSGRLDATLADEHLHLAGRLVGDRDTVAVDASARPFLDRPRVRLAADARLPDLAPLLGRDTIDAGAAARLVVEGELGRRETIRLRGELGARGHFGGLLVDSLHAKLMLADGMLRVDTLSARSNVGGADGTGAIALFRPATSRSAQLQLEGRLSDLEPLAPLLRVGDLGLDTGSFTVSLRGPLDRPSFQLGLEAADLKVGSRRVGAVRATLEGELAADRSVAAGRGRIVLERLATPASRIRGIRLQGSYAARRLRLDTLRAETSDGSWALSHPVDIAYGSRIHVNDFVLASGNQRIAVDGTVDRRGVQHLSARVDSLRLGAFADLLGLTEVDGQADGSLDLTGPAAAPRVTGDMTVLLRARGKDVARARGRVDWIGPRGLHVDLGIYHPKGDSLTVRGQAPLALSLAPSDSGASPVTRILHGELELDAVADRFRVETLQPLLDPATLTSLRGRLTVNAHARGSLEAPALSGRLDLADARIRVPRLGATYDKGRIAVELRGREARLTDLRFESGGGRLAGQGTLVFRTRPAGAIDLRLLLDDFQAAMTENLRAKVSGTLTLGGTTGAPALRGVVQLRSSDVYLQMKGLSHSAEQVELTPADLRMLERRFARAGDLPFGAARSVWSPWAVAVDVALAGNDWLRRRTDPVTAVELTGKLQVRKQRGEAFQLFGAIRPVPGRSFVQVVGRRFEVTDGAVNLRGPLKAAGVSLHAEYRADSGSSASQSGVLITARMAVDTGRLSLTLGSVPPMSRADVMSYLTTGRPAGTDPTLASDESGVLTTGASLAVGAALGKVAGGAAEKLGADVVQILQDRKGGQTLVAGKYVSPALYLGLRQPIVAAEDAKHTDAANESVEFEAEYAALRRALLNLQGGGSEFRVFLRLRR